MYRKREKNSGIYQWIQDFIFTPGRKRGMIATGHNSIRRSIPPRGGAGRSGPMGLAERESAGAWEALLADAHSPPEAGERVVERAHRSQGWCGALGKAVGPIPPSRLPPSCDLQVNKNIRRFL